MSEFLTGKDLALDLMGVAPTIEEGGQRFIVPWIFKMEAEKLFSGQIAIPREQVISSIAASSWAQRWAQGILAFGLGPEGIAALPEATRRARVNDLARRLAERVAPSEVTAPAPPTPPAVAAPRRRRAA